MLEGFYTAASGMLMQQRTLDVLTNNMANVKTPGFRTERVISSTFEHELLTRMERGNTGFIGTGDPVRVVEEVPTQFDPSSLEETGRPFDVAINGEGYFNIQGVAQPAADATGAAAAAQPTGEQFLTRNGNFDIDSEGYLILRDVGRVLGEKGPLQVKGSNFTISAEGYVYDDQDKQIDRVLVTVPAPEVKMEKVSNGLYTVPDFAQNTTPQGATVMQKILERPNINLNREYTLVIEAQRSFQSCSAALRIVDEMNQKTAALSSL